MQLAIDVERMRLNLCKKPDYFGGYSSSIPDIGIAGMRQQGEPQHGSGPEIRDNRHHLSLWVGACGPAHARLLLLVGVTILALTAIHCQRLPVWPVICAILCCLRSSLTSTVHFFMLSPLFNIIAPV